MQDNSVSNYTQEKSKVDVNASGERASEIPEEEFGVTRIGYPIIPPTPTLSKTQPEIIEHKIVENQTRFMR